MCEELIKLGYKARIAVFYPENPLTTTCSAEDQLRNLNLSLREAYLGLIFKIMESEDSPPPPESVQHACHFIKDCTSDDFRLKLVFRSAVEPFIN